jgi:hypothetical protein
VRPSWSVSDFFAAINAKGNAARMDRVRYIHPGPVRKSRNSQLQERRNRDVTPRTKVSGFAGIAFCEEKYRNLPYSPVRWDFTCEAPGSPAKHGKRARKEPGKEPRKERGLLIRERVDRSGSGLRTSQDCPHPGPWSSGELSSCFDPMLL